MGKIVIVGAGLAGSLMASRLSARHQVTVIEQADRSVPVPVTDDGRKARLAEHVGAGPGGTTYLWHNGLVELAPDDFAHWPLAPDEVGDYVPAAHEALSGAELETIQEIAANLRAQLAHEGVPERLLGRPLFYPAQRRNTWQSEHLDQKPLRRVIGRVERLAVDNGGRVTRAIIADQQDAIAGDVFILAAGGLGSPIILQASGGPAASNAGRFYHDHPGGLVAELRVRGNLSRLWNRFDGRVGGSVRLPMIVREAGRKFAFYFRPAGSTGRKVKSVLSALRNKPLDPRNYLRLLARSNDVIEALSLKAGINLPIRRFYLYMSAEQLPQDNIAIAMRDGRLVRDWRLGDDFAAAGDRAIRRLIEELSPMLESHAVFPDWADEIETAAHHSGTCRMAASERDGVIDRDGRVFGSKNLFVCDGSVLPAAGCSNTGLTIGALALRTAEVIDD